MSEIYKVFDNSGLTALTDHMKVTRTKANSNEAAIETLGEDLAGLSEEVVTAIGNKQDKLTFDSTPTSGSVNPVTSGGVKTYADNNFAAKTHEHSEYLTEQVQSDWNQNDETQPDVILNKPDKLSDFENDLFYSKKTPFLTLTKSDFQEWVDPDGNTVYLYTSSPKIDGITSEKNISWTLNAMMDGVSETIDSESESDLLNIIFNKIITDDGETAWFYSSEMLDICNGIDYKNRDGSISKDEYTVALWVFPEIFTAFTDLNMNLFRIDKKILEYDVLPDLVGKNVTDTEYTIDNETVIAYKGAEIFNDYEGNIATGKYAHAEGHNTTASGDSSHAEGYNSKASNTSSHAEGGYARATGEYAHAEGYDTTASGYASHAEGMGYAKGTYSHAEGMNASAYGYASHAEGYETRAEGEYSHAEGFAIRYNPKLTGDANTTTYTADSVVSLSIGMMVFYAGNSAKIVSIDSNNKTIVLDKSISDVAFNAQQVDAKTCASGECSHAEGYGTTASGKRSHAEGGYARATGEYAHAEGHNTTASGDSSHAEGYNSKASNASSHAEGQGSEASGVCSHAEGMYTRAKGAYSHAEGHSTNADGVNSHAEGYWVYASSNYQHAQGKFNIKDTSGTYAHIVGNGESNSALSNAHTLDWEGNAWFQGDVYVGSTSGTNKDAGSVKLVKEGHEHLFDRGVTTEGDGAAYTATVEGITALTAGISFIMIPHTASTSQTATLNVNGLGAKQLRRPLSSNNTTTVANSVTNWMYAGKPVRVMYNGTFWIVMDMPRPHATDLYGTIPVENLPDEVIKNGDTELVLTSPNGTQFKITVNDSGNLTITEITV